MSRVGEPRSTIRLADHRLEAVLMNRPRILDAARSQLSTRKVLGRRS